MRRPLAVVALVAVLTSTVVCSRAQNPSPRLELNRTGETIVLEPCGPNILRVTLSLQRESAMATPGYGLIAAPDAAGWSASRTSQTDVYSSPRMTVSVDRERPAGPPPLHTMVDIAKYFNGSTPDTHITIRTPDGRKLLELTRSCDFRWRAAHCRTIFATERGVVASSKMLPATDHKVVPEGGDEETHERGST